MAEILVVLLVLVIVAWAIYKFMPIDEGIKQLFIIVMLVLYLLFVLDRLDVIPGFV